MEKPLEALIIPTGPAVSEESRLTNGAKSYFEKSTNNNVDPYVIITGTFGSDYKEAPRRQKAHEILNYWGVPKDSIIHEDKSINTRQNIIYTGEILQNENTNIAELNTDRWHAMKMEMLFQKAIKLGYAPKELELSRNSKNIPDSYPFTKAMLAYFKDLILPLENN